MVPILDWIFEGIVNWISSIASQLLDAVSGLFLDALGTDMTAMEQYFPFVTKAYEIMQYSAWAILFLICIWQIFRAFGGPITEAENPWYLVVRGGIYAVLIGYAKPIFSICLDIARAPYTSLMDVTMAAEDFSFAGIEQALTNGLTTLVASASVVGLILILILLIALGWNYFKLLLEVVERYIVVGVMCYTSPLAFSTGGSKATNNVFKSWCRMVGSQLLLLVMNVWFLRGFASSAGQFIGNGGALTTGKGSIFLWMFCALAYLKCAQRFDSYLASIGLNVAQTGSSMAMEMMMAARVVSGVGSGARSAGSVFGRSGGGATATGTGAAATGFAAGFASRFNPNSYVRDAVVDGGSRMGFSGGAGFVGRVFGGMAARNGATLTGDSISSVASRAPGVSGTIAGDIADRSLANYMPHMSGFQAKGTQITGGHISTTATTKDGRSASVDMYHAAQYEKPDAPHSVVTASDGSQWYQMASGEGRGAFYDAPNFGGIQTDTPHNAEPQMGDQPAPSMDGTAAPAHQAGAENADGQDIPLNADQGPGSPSMGDPQESSGHTAPGEVPDGNGMDGILAGEGQFVSNGDMLQQDAGGTNLGMQESVNGAMPTEMAAEAGQSGVSDMSGDQVNLVSGAMDQPSHQDTPSNMGGMPLAGMGEIPAGESGNMAGIQPDIGEQNGNIHAPAAPNGSDGIIPGEDIQMPFGMQPDGSMPHITAQSTEAQPAEVPMQPASQFGSDMGMPVASESAIDVSGQMGSADMSYGARFFGVGVASDMSEQPEPGDIPSGGFTESHLPGTQVQEGTVAGMQNADYQQLGTDGDQIISHGDMPFSQSGSTPSDNPIDHASADRQIGGAFGVPHEEHVPGGAGTVGLDTHQGGTVGMPAFSPEAGISQFSSEQLQDMGGGYAQPTEPHQGGAISGPKMGYANEQSDGGAFHAEIAAHEGAHGYTPVQDFVGQGEQSHQQMVSEGISSDSGSCGDGIAPSVQGTSDAYVQPLSSQQGFTPDSGYGQQCMDTETAAPVPQNSPDPQPDYGMDRHYGGPIPTQTSLTGGNDQSDHSALTEGGSFFGGSHGQPSEHENYHAYTEAPLVAATFPAAQEGTTLRTVGEGLIEASSPDGGNSLWYNSAFYQEPDAPHSVMEAANGVQWYTMQPRGDIPHFEQGDDAAAYNQAAFRQFMPGYDGKVSQVDDSNRQDGHFEVRHEDGSGTAFYDASRYNAPRGDYRLLEDAKGSRWYAIRGEAAVERRPVFEDGKAVYDGEKLRTVMVETVRYKQAPAKYQEPKKRGDIVKKPPRRKM